MNTYSKLMLFLGIVFVWGCSKLPLLEEAKTSYNDAIQDSLLVAKAPGAIEDAEKEFLKINNLKKNGASDDLIEHHAYIARQKVAIAWATAELNTKLDEVEKAEAERQIVMKKYEEAEALAAERRAEEERIKQEKAQREAALYAQRVSELSAEKTNRGLVLTLKNVIFAAGKATLKPGSEQHLINLAEFLKEYPERNVLIEGYTDNTGSDKINMELSERRADAVKKALVSMGIENSRIQTRGYGEQYAIADNSTPEGRQMNRRVEIVISDKRGTLTARHPTQ